VVVRTGDDTRFEAGHVPCEGQALRALEPDYALAAYFEWPIGTSLTYRVGDQVERLESHLDGWGRIVLRSVERRSELVLVRSESSLAAYELRGSARTLLAWLRLCISLVPFDREPRLKYRSVLPQRWLGGSLRALRWDLTAAFARVPGVELHAQLELTGDHLTIRGTSGKQARGGVPLVQTRVVLRRGVGPTLIEVVMDGRAQRAELLGSSSRAASTRPSERVEARPSLGFRAPTHFGAPGDWS
jgi:hypothetical protein